MEMVMFQLDLVLLPVQKMTGMERLGLSLLAEV